MAISDAVRILLAEVDAARGELLDLCAALVEAPSVSPPGDTRAAAEAARTFLASRGLEIQVAADQPTMPNLLVTVDGRGTGRHLVLNGHLDTMEPGDRARWTVPPFRLTRVDGRLHGLDMGNMKGAVAALAVATAALARARDHWAGRVTLTMVSDEVLFGEHGSAWLLRTRPELRADGLLSGEGPGAMRLAVGEKGVLWVRLDATGPAGHASRVERGRSAVTRLAAVASAVDELNGLAASLPPELAGHLEGVEPAELRLSANVATLQGGTVPSQIAAEAQAVVDFRLPPGLTLDAVEGRVAEAVASVPDVVWRRLKGWDANWTDPADPLVGAVRDAATEVRGAPPASAIRLPGSDASRWRSLGVPAVCYGPQPTLAAGVDDYALERDVLDCARVYALAAARFCSA